MTIPAAEDNQFHQENQRFFLVWSNEHGGWWKKRDCGYSSDVELAERYTHKQALKRCTWEGETRIPPNEVMVLAPEYAGLQL